MSASSFVRELPLDALLPQSSTNDIVDESIKPPRPIIEAVKEETPPIYPKLETSVELPQIILNGGVVEDVLPQHKNIYPSIQTLIEHGEREFLNEAQLLTYYQNEQLDFVDDFVDEFVTVCFIKLIYFAYCINKLLLERIESS